MPANAQVKDTVRASREGHWFHEAWTARKAMQLLLPKEDLIGIAVEGLSEADQSRASAETVQIADLTVYYGQDASFCDADRVETVQFKYSPKRADKPFRASDAKNTIEKFAESYCDYKRNYGATEVTKKLFFTLITNRPVFRPLQQAIDGIAGGRRLTGDAIAQAEQFKRATGLTGTPLAEFAGKCQINGLAGTLRETNTDLWKILVDWSATADAQAGARLGAIREMVTRKAGYDAQYRKVIRQVDLLDVLGLSDVSDLLPCPESLACIGQIVEREQLAEAASLVPALIKPLIIHADGGIGKTVFLQSLASLISQQHEVVFFDCFGGGSYRSPEDGRHLPYRGLVHIANLLACRGLCDPILPGSENIQVLFATFRKRLAQCVRTIGSVSPDRELVLFIDALDNAAEYANESGSQAFSTLMLESIQLSGPIPGVKVVASGRTHRIRKYISSVLYHAFELHAFTIAESTAYLSSRMADVTETEIRVAQSRSEGNGRILEHLVTSDRGLLEPSEIEKPILLDELLNERIETALEEVTRQGYNQEEINMFLAGLSVLPPPVPLDEYAGASGMDVGAIRSFAADLAPLLDRTRQGMIFRDEPTETLVRERYGADTGALRRVARNLLARQALSVYAAQALPGLLQMLGDGKELFNLALDERFPRTITSTVGKRRIRYARLKAAVQYAANASDSSSLVRLLVELSTIAASDQRGANYILENPDLVVNAQDADALRRLFETRTEWAGSRPARLAIASVLSGDLDDASRHYTNAVNWIRHDLDSVRDNNYDRPRPEHVDRAAVPFFCVVQGISPQAIGFMRMWYPWYAFEISEELFELFRQAIRRDHRLRRAFDAFLGHLTNEIGPLTGALAFVRLSYRTQRELAERLGRACKRDTNLIIPQRHFSVRRYELPDGLRKAATIAASLGMIKEALSISLRAPHQRPRIWSMVNLHSNHDLFPFLFRVSLRAGLNGTEVHERDIFPIELVPLAKGLRRSLTGGQLNRRLKHKLQAQMKKEVNLKESERQSRDKVRRDTERFLDHRVVPLVELTRALASFLGADLGQVDGPFQDLVRVWVRVRRNREEYYNEGQFNRFFQLLGTRMVTFALWARCDLKAVSIRFFLKQLHRQNYVSPSTLIEVISIVAARPRFDVIAGEQAVHARSLIEREDEITTRSELFAKLARAILPASASDASEYFRVGLEQLDAIGSGDYKFTNALLEFSSSVKGDELSEKDFHTLTNICELNMPEEAEKFPWASFATAMSKAAGPRGLAKLSRWHDRGKVRLEYTLLPYLVALVRDRKIAPEDALALNRLADPVELWDYNTETFAITVYEKRFSKAKELITELIRQYEENNPLHPSGRTLKELAAIAADVLGRQHATTRHLSGAHRRLSDESHDLNGQGSCYRSSRARLGQLPNDAENRVRQVRKIATTTNPLDGDSLRNALSKLSDFEYSRDYMQKLFRKLRARVSLADRLNYIDLIAHLEELDCYIKFSELAECKSSWVTSSAGLDGHYRTLSTPILEIHADDFLSFGGLSTCQLKKVSDLTGVSVPVLSLELVRVFSKSNSAVPAAAWLGLAAIICTDSDEGHGQKALGALLGSGSARLTSTVVDGPWTRGMYLSGEMSTIASGLVWQLFGSPRATDRWRAAHSVRCFARLGRWRVIDELAGKLLSTDSKAFGAPELPFYYLHARLWLLIALARVALDFPTEIAKHRKSLMKVALDRSHPHIIVRHFAGLAVLACDKAAALSLSEKEREQLRSANDSPFPHRSQPERHDPYAGFYDGRPDDAPDPDDRFGLDYDFNKNEVHHLASVFDQPGWAAKDYITGEAHRLDPTVTSMYDKAGREIPYRHGVVGLTSSFHVYGHYLAWHALRFVAARLLSLHPITENWNHGERWSEWLSHTLLTRSDGLWLSDGMDRPPLSVKVNVLEKGKKGRVLTGDRKKLMSLVGIDSRTVGRDIVVAGDWKSPDGIDVHVSSALVHGQKGRRLSLGLLEEDAFSVWLPTLEYDDDELERFRSERREFKPWIVSPSVEGAELDRDDPFSVVSVEERPRFVPWIAEHYSLKPGDPFQRTWLMAGRKCAATTDAWGFQRPYEEGGEASTRLVCRTRFLSSVLEWKNADLIILIKLRRYEKGDTVNRRSSFSHTVAVLRVRRDLSVEYFAGPVNQ